MATIHFTKGQGTGNDFVLYSDPEGRLPLTAAQIAEICDRHFGVGADGVIRAVRSAHLPEGEAALAEDDGATWFMDYYNADGSPAEMCGNGIRVFVAYLEAAGLLTAADGAPVAVGTRGGVRQVWRTGDLYTVDMGPWGLPGGPEAVSRGFDVAVQVAGLEGTRAGLRVAMPNPHAVVALADLEELAAADLGPLVETDPPAPDGVNVELAVPLGETTVDGEAAGVVRMRVQERGVGETRSCGTGTCAVAVALHAWGGPQAPRLWQVLVPGGEVLVRLEEGHALLTGPAELVADVTLR